MKWFQLFTALLPFVEAIVKSIEETLASGKQPADVHQVIVDHVAELPVKIRTI